MQGKKQELTTDLPEHRASRLPYNMRAGFPPGFKQLANPQRRKLLVSILFPEKGARKWSLHSSEPRAE